MNAHELAEIVDKWAYSESAEYLTDAANMLRQQADQIAELEKENKKLRWDVNHREMDIDVLKTKLIDAKWKYDCEAHEYKYSIKYVRELEDKIAELEKQLYFKDYYEELPDTPVGLQTTPQTKLLSDEEIGDFQYLIIRACGLSTCDSNVNAIGLRRILRAIEAKVRGEK